MNCQNCHEPLDPGAAFCGNCGFPVQGNQAAPPAAATTPPAQNNQTVGQIWQQDQQMVQTAPPPPALGVPLPTPGAAAAATIPTYAKTTTNQHVGETQALLAVICGIIGIAGAAFLIPIIGLAFGVLGLCMGTLSHHVARRRLAMIGLAFSVLAIAAGFAALAYNQQHLKNTTPNAQTGQSSTSSTLASTLSTPCYSFNLVDQYNVSNSSGSCDATAYNGQSFVSSTDIYKIVAATTDVTAPGSFTEVAKQAIDKDFQTNLPGYSITSQGASSFAGSITYTAYATNPSEDAAVVETVVLHQSSHGENVFDILHGVNGSSVNLQALESKWQWK